MIINSGLETVEALAFEPLSQLLYWVDSGFKKIEVGISHAVINEVSGGFRGLPGLRARLGTGGGASMSDFSGSPWRIPEAGPAEPPAREEKGDSFRVLARCPEGPA